MVNKRETSFCALRSSSYLLAYCISQVVQDTLCSFAAGEPCLQKWTLSSCVPGLENVPAPLSHLEIHHPPRMCWLSPCGSLKASAYLTRDDVNILYALYPNRILDDILHGISWRENLFFLFLGDCLHFFCAWVAAETLMV